MAIEHVYASQVRDETGLFATWLPSAHIEIGQYGSVQGALFQSMNQLAGLHASPSPATADYDFTIHADRAINNSTQALIDAGVSSGNTLLELSFHKEAAVSFSAPKAVISRVDNIEALGAKLVKMQKAGAWKPGNAIVVEVVTVPRATIIISRQSGAQIKFEVGSKTPISGEVMVKLDESGSLKMSKGVGVKIIGKGPLTPMFRLAFLKSRVLRDPEIAFRGPGGEVVPEEIKISGEHYLAIY